MSVIPWTMDGNEPTVVETKEDFEQGVRRGRHVVFVMNLDSKQLRSERDANVTYDLRVGNGYRDHRDVAPASLHEDQSITLLPGAAVIIQTEEWIQLPRTMFGHVVPKVSLLQAGVSNTSSKVDPGYIGYLLVTVFNLGKRPVLLERRQPFCALYLLGVEGQARPYSKPGQGLEGRLVPTNRWSRFADWAQRHDAIIKSALMVASALLTAGVTLLAAYMFRKG